METDFEQGDPVWVRQRGIPRRMARVEFVLSNGRVAVLILQDATEHPPSYLLLVEPHELKRRLEQESEAA